MNITTAEIRELREKLLTMHVVLAQSQRAFGWVVLTPKQLEYLAHKLRSDLIWREWLLPDET